VTLRYTALVLAVLIACGAVIARVYEVGGADGAGGGGTREAHAAPKPRPPYATAPAAVRLRPRFKHAPRAALVWDVRSGRVLWSRRANVRRPVASLAKMMTAVVVDDRARWRERVRIGPAAKAAPGSAVGLLAPGRRVRLRTLIYGLLLPSGNDAAVALAEHVGGDLRGFVDTMNARGRALGLRCTSFSSPDGYQDRGNVSCARDLAVLAREVLRRPRLARVVRTRYASFRSLLPHTGKVRGKEKTVWKPGRLHMASHNPLLRMGYRGTTGVKTGYTDAAGRCFVGTARRGRRHLGVVLLGSPDPGGQAQRLLDRAFRALRDRPHTRRA
jgi:serine-type D-Ala-D-Ala carboxypeptidase (penicillin-binding protein 5/6)